MRLIRRVLACAIVPLLPWLSGPLSAQVYKWTDESGRVHYGAKKPENAPQAYELDIGGSPAPPASNDSAAEIARIKALSEQMASERQALEQARQQQAIRDLERQNQQLQKDLLTEQLQQEQEAKQPKDEIILGYPPPYVYPPLYPPSPYPPSPYPPPCEPWPDCRRPHPPPPVQPPRPPVSKPHPPFNPKPAGVDLRTRGAFW
ncbi:MAG TPA: DUF4124 domain-containing protein [Candidatus Competibacter sp.]|nr:DUF4124 domain-containing protein [Candidatus Competibacter sp.]HUM95524.1 DUF4124 domain-containing protein [Candidatus Competibacter sp.]